MKRIVFSFLLLGITAGAWAQKPVKFKKDDVLKLLAEKKYGDAKDLIDKVLANPKEQDNKEAITYKAVIYANLATDSALAGSNPDALQTTATTLDQLKQNTDTAAFNKLMREDQGINAVSVVYSKAFNNGLSDFKDSKWDDAYKNFHTAYSWADYITKNGFSQNPDRNAIDTFTVLYTGFAAQNASGYDQENGGTFKNPAMADSAMAMYTLLADRNIATKDMPAMYQYMVQYYQAKKDKENAAKYLDIAKKAYPDKNDLWSQIETQAMLSGGNVNDIIANYKEKDAAGQMTEAQYVEIAQTLANAEKSTKDTAEIAAAKAASIDAYQKAFNLGHNGIYAFNVGILNYQRFSELDDEFFANKGEEAAKKAKRDAIEKEQAPLADTSIAWLTKSYDVLSAKQDRDKNESVSLNRAVDIIANLYNWKMNKARGHDPKAYDQYEALFKKFDSLHETFK
ncbi:hypothetical protein SAMN05192529_102292 [Arachidicoccus rhizosphaerae]|uniref:Tetratricopeptide repeat-containing protein n=1 Tax=Arachidicoccus rhizosphaerae TaxID=551991 RepID=A0A1H3WBS7_9BACT|nr:hypothetical protein [Arachidicoccus rhizosphaerae]SDZ84430.1 hypothetical protein SAMN05192529_102292 [Arachidicoccus rhizosphaerae]